MQMAAMMEKTNGYSCFNGHKCIIIQQILIKLCIYATNFLAPRNVATFVFDLGYAALDILEIWSAFCGESIYFTLELR